MDDIVWIREEPSAPNIENYSAADNSIVVEHFSTSLSSQADTEGSFQIPLINGVKPTYQLPQNQFPESVEEKRKFSEEKRVTFNIPTPYINDNATPFADSLVQKQLDVQSQVTPEPSSKEGGFNITVSYLNTSENKSTDNSSEKQPEQPNQNPPEFLEKGASYNESFYSGTTWPVVDSSIQKQSDEKVQENSSKTNERGGFNIMISYPGDTENKPMDNLSEKQAGQPGQCTPKELEKGSSCNASSYSDNTWPVVDSSFQRQSEDKVQETLKKTNERGGFNIMVSYPGASENKSADNSFEKQSEQTGQNTLEKRPPCNESSYSGSTWPIMDSSFQRQSEDKVQETSKEANERGSFNIAISYPGATENKSTDSSSEKWPEQPAQKPPNELEQRVSVSETSCIDSNLPVVDSSIQKQSDDNIQEASKEATERRGFAITVSYPSDAENKLTDSTSEKQPEQSTQKPLNEFEQRVSVDEMSCPDSTLPVVDSSTQKHSDNKTQEASKETTERGGFGITVFYPSASENKFTDNSSEKQSEHPAQKPPNDFEPRVSVSGTSWPNSTLPIVGSSIQKQFDDKTQEVSKETNEHKDFGFAVSSPSETFSNATVPINVQVFDSSNKVPPASNASNVSLNSFDSTPISVTKFEPMTTNMPVTTDSTTLKISGEDAKERVINHASETMPTDASSQINKQNDIEKNEDAFDISEYERKLNETTEETKDLVNKLCDTSQKLNQNTKSIANNVAAQRKILFEDVYKTIEDIEQLPPPPELPTGGLAGNVESVIIGKGVLKYVTGCIVLPNGTIMATDEEVGLLLFDVQGNVLKTVPNTNWRKPRSPVCYKEHIMMLVDIEETKGDWCRYIVKFTMNLDYIAKIEGPKWMRNETIVSERLSIAHTDYIYLCVCGEVFSALYELSPIGLWTELQYRISENYLDMLAFAVIGPITQVLVVEGKRGYILQYSIRESEVVDRRRLAVCERPGAMARDEAGRLFIANRASTSIQLVDTVRWTTALNVALTDNVVPHFSASWGLLAVPIKGAIRLQRYSFRLGYK